MKPHEAHPPGGHCYDGGALNDDLPGGRRSGKLCVTEHTLTFTGDEISHSIPLQGISLQEGGASNRLIFFTHATLPGWSFYTSDRSILKNAQLIQSPHTVHALRSVRKKSSIRRGATLAILASLVALTVLGAAAIYSLKEPLIRLAARQIPLEWEEKLGEVAFSQIALQSQFITDERTLHLLKGITDPVAAEAKKQSVRPYKYRFHLAINDEVNAFALPGGHMVINSGLIEKADSAEEVAGVVAHELAHVNLQHSIRQIMGSLGIYVAVQTFLGDMEGLIAVMADNSAYLLTLTFSRGYEEEADNTGWDYLVGAGIRPEGMVQFFETLRKEEEKSDAANSIPTILSTHPATEKRMENLKEKWDNLKHRESLHPLPVNFPALQKQLRIRSAHKALDTPSPKADSPAP